MLSFYSWNRIAAGFKLRKICWACTNASWFHTTEPSLIRPQHSLSYISNIPDSSCIPRTLPILLNLVRALQHAKSMFQPSPTKRCGHENPLRSHSPLTPSPGKCSTHLALINDVLQYSQCFFKKKKKKNQFIQSVAMYYIDSSVVKVCFAPGGSLRGWEGWMEVGRKKGGRHR